MTNELELTKAEETQLTAERRNLLRDQITVAAANPRSITRVEQEIVQLCERPRFAEKALYVLPFGDTRVTGFSIRFAEAAIQAMGNIAIVVDMLGLTDDERYMRVAVVCMDVEKNVAFGRTALVRAVIERSRFIEGRKLIETRKNSKGKPVYVYPANERELQMAVNSVISKTVRNEGLRLLPAWLKEEAMEVIEETMTDEAARDREKFVSHTLARARKAGITVAALETAFRKPVEGFTREDWKQVLGWISAVEEGATSWAEIEMSMRPEAHEQKMEDSDNEENSSKQS